MENECENGPKYWAQMLSCPNSNFYRGPWPWPWGSLWIDIAKCVHMHWCINLL